MEEVLLIHNITLLGLAVLTTILTLRFRKLTKATDSALSSIEQLSSHLYKVRRDAGAAHLKLNGIAESLKEINLADAKTVNRRINRLIYRVNQLEFRIEAAEILTRRHEEALSQTLVEEQTQYKPSNKIPQQ